MNYIPLSETGYFSRIILDYANDDAKLKSFYKERPEKKNIIQSASKKVFNSETRKILVEVLSEQYQGLPNSTLVSKNIKSLISENTFTITTGHQLSFLTGPLYFLYKIAQAIKLSEELAKSDSQHNYVPVYWMASEDHDQAEVNHAHILGQKIQWPETGEDACGRMSSSVTIDAINELRELLLKFNFPAENFDAILACYSNSINLSDATRRLVHLLFGEYGIVIIDADDKRLKGGFSDFISDELINETSSHKVQETLDIFPDEYKVQVNPRAINLFYLHNNVRSRIIKNDAGQYFANEELIAENEHAILEIVKSNAERFSPNVVLRPLYQEVILPNLAYVGGGGELAYWFEYKKLFDHYKVEFPYLILRNSLLLLDQGSLRKMEKFSISAKNLFTDTDLLIRQFVKEDDSEHLDISSEMNEIEFVFSKLSDKAGVVDATLKPSFEAEKQKQIKLLQQLQDRLIRAYKKKHETEVNQIRALRDKMFPNSSLQERHDNFLNFYLKYPDFIALILEELNPLSMEFGIIELH